MIKKITGLKGFLLLLGTVVFLQAASQQTANIYVSTKGSAKGTGKPGNPVRSIDAAINLADHIARSGKTGYKEIRILIERGTYFIDSTIEIVSGKNWHSTVPLTITALKGEKVVVHGGKIVPPALVKPVTDAAYSSRFIPSARHAIREVDLAKLGIKDLGELRPVGFSRPTGPTWMELFLNKVPGQIARWPNDSSVLTGLLIDSGSIARWGDNGMRGGRFTYEGTQRPSRWQDPQKIWISGYFMWGYAMDAVPLQSIDTATRTITTAIPTMYGFGTGKPWRAWYAYNLPEEIDRKGEYYVDVARKKLYFLPPDTLKQLELSVLEAPMLAMEGVSGVHIEGIHFTCSRGMGIYMERTTGVRVRSCTFSNLGMMAVSMGKGVEASGTNLYATSGTPRSRIVGSVSQHMYDNTTYDPEAGTDNGFEDCEIYQTGAGGIFLRGGNRITLEPGNNFVRNCRISDYNRVEQSAYRPGIWVSGVGNHISNCDIFNAPATAIFLHGNDHTIEYNNIYNVALTVDDMGAFYYGRDPSERGNIVRYNYFHHIGSRHKTMAVYHDDGACGTQVYGNIFYKAGTVAGFIGGGMDNPYFNNVFIDIKYASHIDDRLKSWAKAMLEPDGLFRKRLNAVNYSQPPYATKYPHLKDYFEDDPAMPKRDTFSNNILVNITKKTEGHESWLPFASDNLVLTSDPGFEDFQKGDFRLRKDSEVWKKLPGFKQIPVEKIGYRAKDSMVKDDKIIGPKTIR